MEMTILESQAFWDELTNRSEAAEQVLFNLGRTRTTEFLREAFELKQEYEEKIKDEHNPTAA